MNLKKYIIACLLPLAGFMAGCSDSEEDSPFEGKDNHFTSFTLTTPDGTLYKASINGAAVTVTVPANVSLAGAKAEYTLCEQARVLPDPAQITDWDSEQVFRLISYNGEAVSCKYSIIRNAISSEGSVTLTTQGDVDEFAKKQVSVIEGNLIIGSNSIEDEPVVNLAPLSALTTVKGSVIVLPSFNGSSLSGLKNLEKAGGILIGTIETPIVTTTALEISLPALRSTGDVLVNSNTAKTLDLPALTDASKVFVQSSKLEELNLGALRHVTGNLEIGKSNVENYTLEKMECPSLESISGNMALLYMTGLKTADFPKLKSVGGYINAQNLSEVESFELPELSEAGAAVTIDVLKAKKVSIPKLSTATDLTITTRNGSSMYDSDIEVIDLGSLKSVDNNLSITSKAINMTSLTLPELETVGESFIFNNLIGLTELNLPKLRSVKTLTMQSFNSLTAIRLPKLEEAPSMTLNGPEVTEIEMPVIADCKALTLNGFTKIQEFRFPALLGNEFEGTLTVISCDNMERISGPAVYKGNVRVTTSRTANAMVPVFVAADGSDVKFTKDYTVTVYKKHISLKGVEAVLGSLSFSGYTLTDIDFGDIRELGSYGVNYDSRVVRIAAPKLEKVNNEIRILGLSGLESLEFPMLKDAGTLTISGNRWNLNTKLKSLAGFSSLETADKIEVAYCPALSDFSPLGRAAATLTDGQWVVNDNLYNPTLEDMKAGRYVPAAE